MNKKPSFDITIKNDSLKKFVPFDININININKKKKNCDDKKIRIDVYEQNIKKKKQEKIKNDIFDKNLSHSLKDVLTGMLYNWPVLAEDGFVYEKSVIENYTMNYTSKSPMTRQLISTEFKDINLLKKIVNEYVKIHPNNKIYKFDNTYNNNKTQIINYIKNGYFDKLFNFTQFELNDTNESSMHYNMLKFKIFKNCNDLNIIKYVIDNSCDAYETDNNGWNLLHSVCKFSNPDIIKYILSELQFIKHINSTNNYKQTPIHIACKFNTQNVIELLVNNGSKIDLIDNEGLNPFQTILKYNEQKSAIGFFLTMMSDSTIKDICSQTYYEETYDDKFASLHYICKTIHDIKFYKLLDSKGINFELETENKIKPIHILSKYCKNPEVIDFLIDEKKVNIESETITGWRPIHFVCKYNSVDMIYHFLTKNVLLNTRIKIIGDSGGYTNYLPINLVELNNTLSNKKSEELVMEIFQIMNTVQNL